MVDIIFGVNGKTESVSFGGMDITTEEAAKMIREQTSWDTKVVDGVVVCTPPGGYWVNPDEHVFHVSSYDRGHETKYDKENDRLVYADTGEPIGTRSCIRCKCMPTPEGYDACAGYIEGARYACCGHGVTKPYLKMKDGTNAKHPRATL